MAQVSVLMPPNQTVYEGDCIVDGIDYRLVKEGLYEAVLTSYETSTRFCKKGKDSKMRDGGKIYFHFHIDPYNNAGLGKEKMIVFMAFNAKQIILPAGKNGKFKVGARTNYVKLFSKLFPGNAKKKRLSPRNLMNKLFLVKVRTVRVNEKQQSLAEYERYSIIDEVIDFA